MSAPPGGPSVWSLKSEELEECDCGKMEEYEKFCEKSLSRIQEASLSTESFLPAQSESISLIRFHGVAILSPLVNLLCF
uniref:Centriolar coiled-coil protein 110 n=1 Tax=Theropithecus gelada TaxID=9565 RepID=A0A8D2FZZ3_THEGE